MDPRQGLRRQVSVKILRENQHVRHTLKPLKGKSYYQSVFISDCQVSNLKLYVDGNRIMETDTNLLEFSDKHLSTAEVRFDVVSVSLFGSAVINIHKYSNTVTEFYDD